MKAMSYGSLSCVERYLIFMFLPTYVNMYIKKIHLPFEFLRTWDYSLGLSGMLKIKYDVSVTDLPGRHSQCQFGSSDLCAW